MKEIKMILEDDEIAVAVPGYEGRYIVTSLGRVFSLLRGKFLKGFPNNVGYLRVNLCDGQSQKTNDIHKIVAKSFEIPGWDDPILEVDHINGDITDNRLVNLQMLTHDKNIQKRDKEKLSKSLKLGMRNSNSPMRSKPCICIELNQFFWSAHEASKSLGKGNGGAGNISLCCRGLYQSAYNLHWRYATEEEIAQHK